MVFVVYPTAKIIIDDFYSGCCKQHLVKCPFKHGENGDVGDFTFIRAKKLTFGEGVHVAPRVTIVGTGSVEIGDYSTIAPGVVIYTSVPDLRFGTNKYAGKFELKEGNVKIGKNCFIGANAIINQGTNIPDNAVIPAGTYVTENNIAITNYSDYRGKEGCLTIIAKDKLVERIMEWRP